MAGASRKATSGTTSWEQDGWVFPESEGDVGEGRPRKTKAGGKEVPLRFLARITGAWRRSAPMLAPVDTAGPLGSVAAASQDQATSKNTVPGGSE